jgi:glycosyltransferase involved in cell wall biosynthesis
MTRLAVLASHPVQYYGPLFRELAQRVDLTVLFAYRATPADQARAGFGTAFDWDIDLTSGYPHEFLDNVSVTPGTEHYAGCDTPGIGRRLRGGRYDALLVMGWHLKSYVQGIMAAKRIGLSVLVRGDSQLATPRSSLKRVAKSLAYPPLLRLFDAALYVGQRSKAYYTHYQYPEDRLYFSPHCVDTERFGRAATEAARRQIRANAGISAAAETVLFAGKLLPFKRPLDVVLAAARLKAKGRPVEILVAGDGELREPMITTAEAAGVPIHMLGFRNQSEMPAVYAAADALVLPSDARETWGLVANEALASGRPVIVSDACGCAPDLAADGGVGRAFPVGDTAALAGSIAALLVAPPSLAAIRDVSDRHALSAAVNGIEAALRNLRQRRRTQAGR